MDNVCAFLRPGEVVLAWTDDETDPQYPLSQQTLAYLEGETDARGRKLVIHKLRFPIIRSALQRRNWQGIRLPKGRMSGRRESVLRHPT